MRLVSYKLLDVTLVIGHDSMHVDQKREANKVQKYSYCEAIPLCEPLMDGMSSFDKLSPCSFEWNISSLSFHSRRCLLEMLGKWHLRAKIRARTWRKWRSEMGKRDSFNRNYRKLGRIHGLWKIFSYCGLQLSRRWSD